MLITNVYISDKNAIPYNNKVKRTFTYSEGKKGPIMAMLIKKPLTTNQYTSNERMDITSSASYELNVCPDKKTNTNK